MSTLAELIDAGSTARDLKDNGFSATDLKDAGFLLSELKPLFTLAELKTAGFTATEVVADGFNPTLFRIWYRDTFGDGWNDGSISFKETNTNLNIITLNGPPNSTKAWYFIDAIFNNNTNYTITKVGGSYPSEIIFAVTTTNTSAYLGTETIISTATDNFCILTQRSDALSSFSIPSKYFFSAAELRTAGFNATELKAALFNAAELKAAGFLITELTDLFSLAELKAAGFTAAELRDLFSLAELKTANFTATELVAAGFTASQLRTALFTLAELKPLFTLAELKTALFTARELQATLFRIWYRDTFGDGWNNGSISFKETNTNLNIITLNGPPSGTKAWYFIDANFKINTNYTITKVGGSWPSEIIFAVTTTNTSAYLGTITPISTATDNFCILTQRSDALGSFSIPSKYYVSAAELRTAGFDATELKDLFSLAELKTAGFTAADLKPPLFTLEQLVAARFNATDLKTAGFTATELKPPLFTLEQLVAARFNATDLKDAQFTASDLKPPLFTLEQLVAAEFSATNLKDAQFTATDLKPPLFTLEQLVAAQFTATNLKDAGFDATDLKPYFNAADLKPPLFTLEQLVAARFSATNLKDLFTLEQLVAVGFLLSELVSAGFNARDLKPYFNATELKDSFTPSELKDLFTLAELFNSGFTSTILFENNIDVSTMPVTNQLQILDVISNTNVKNIFIQSDIILNNPAKLTATGNKSIKNPTPFNVTIRVE